MIKTVEKGFGAQHLKSNSPTLSPTVAFLPQLLIITSLNLQISTHKLYSITMASLKSRLQHFIAPIALRSYLAEFISTFIYVFTAVGAAISSRKAYPPPPFLFPCPAIRFTDLNYVLCSVCYRENDGVRFYVKYCNGERLRPDGGGFHICKHFRWACQPCRHLRNGHRRPHYYSHGHLLLDFANSRLCSRLPRRQNYYRWTGVFSILQTPLLLALLISLLALLIFFFFS